MEFPSQEPMSEAFPRLFTAKDLKKLVSEDLFGYQQAIAPEYQHPWMVDEVIRRMQDEMTDEMEERIKKDLTLWFGSYEAAVPYLHLFILEDSNVDISQRDDKLFNSYIYQMQTQYRFRLKTPEELFGPLAGAYMTMYGSAGS